MNKRSRRGVMVLGAGLPLAFGGCAGLLTARNAPAPAEYRLTPRPSFPADLPRRDWVLVVAEPNAEGALDTARIAILNEGRVERLADANWSDRATAMLQFLIVQAFQASGRLRGVGTDREDLPGRYLLQTTLNAFQLEPEAGGYAADVRLYARLLQLPGRGIASAQEFVARVPAAAPSTEAAIAAFDQGVTVVLEELVAWTLRSARDRR